ncbi:WD repeat-containing protein DWA2-like [Wolffia australiana]
MQGGSTGIVYGGLKYQARCITDVKADTDNVCFLAGTLSLREENEVHLIRLSPSSAELICEGLFYHPGEIWHLASCPFDGRLFSAVFASGETDGAVVWKIPELYGPSNSPQLEKLVSFDGHPCKIKSVLWWPGGKHDKVISIDEQNIFLWDLNFSMQITEAKSKESVEVLHSISGGVWDPHDRNSVATFCDSSFQCWDLRSMKKTSSIEHIHVRDADYNPNKRHIIATAEDEIGIHLWDLRMPKIPFIELPGHAHWTWAVRHNPQHDQLILSSGTDSTVNLWLACTASNSDSESGVDSPNRSSEPLVHSYTDYENSVYGISWSSREPSLFASLSYDGRVVVESVEAYLPRK